MSSYNILLDELWRVTQPAGESRSQTLRQTVRQAERQAASQPGRQATGVSTTSNPKFMAKRTLTWKHGTLDTLVL